MSSNLNKYEILKHRHLSLLKALDAMGVSAKCNNDTGEWSVMRNDPAPYSLELDLLGRCVGLHTQVYDRHSPVKFGTVYGIGYQYQEMYAREWYLLDTDGKVTFRREAEANVPEWVSEFAAQYQQNRVRNVVFLDGEKTFISQLTNQHCGMFQVPKGCEFVAFDWDRPLEPSQCQPERALLDHMFQCNYSMGVRSDGQAVVFCDGAEKLPVLKGKMTPTITHLLDALKTAILEQSPAKVD